jgi:hypothetical protein
MRAGQDGDPYLDFSRPTRDQAAALAEVTVEGIVDGRGRSRQRSSPTRAALNVTSFRS